MKDEVLIENIAEYMMRLGVPEVVYDAHSVWFDGEKGQRMILTAMPFPGPVDTGHGDMV